MYAVGPCLKCSIAHESVAECDTAYISMQYATMRDALCRKPGPPLLAQFLHAARILHAHYLARYLHRMQCACRLRGCHSGLSSGPAGAVPFAQIEELT